jgi:SH3 domain
MSASGPSSPSVHSDEFASLPDSDPPFANANPTHETPAHAGAATRPTGAPGGEPLLAGMNTSPVSMSPSDSKIAAGPTDVQFINHRLSLGSNEGKFPTSANGGPLTSAVSAFSNEIPGRQNSQSSLPSQRPTASVQHRPSISSVAELGQAMTGTITGPAELVGTIDENPMYHVEAPTNGRHASISTYEQAGPSPANPLYTGPHETHSPVPSTSSLSSPPPAGPGATAPPLRPYGRFAPPPPRVVRAVAMYDFEPEGNEGQELAFRAGDMIEIIAKTKELDIGGWCTARVQGSWKTALAPISYLHELPNQAPPAVQRPPHRTQTAPVPNYPPVQHEQYHETHQHQQGYQHQIQEQQHGQQQHTQSAASVVSHGEQGQSQSVTVNVQSPSSADPATYPGPNHNAGHSARPRVSVVSSESSHVPSGMGSMLASGAANAAGRVIENKIGHQGGIQYAPHHYGAAAEYYGGANEAAAPGYGGAGGSTAPIYNVNYAGGPQPVPAQPAYVPSPLYPGYGPAPQPMYGAGPPAAGSYAVPAAAGAVGASLGLTAAARLSSNLAFSNQHDNYSTHANSTALNLAGANISLFSNDGNDTNTSNNQLAVSQSAVVADQEVVVPTQNVVATPGDYVVVDNTGASPLASLAPNTAMTDTYFTGADSYSTGVSPLAGLASPAVVTTTSDYDVTSVSGPGGSYFNETETDTYVATDGMGDAVVEQETFSDTAYADNQGDSYVQEDVSYDAYVEDDTLDLI